MGVARQLLPVGQGRVRVRVRVRVRFRVRVRVRVSVRVSLLKPTLILPPRAACESGLISVTTSSVRLRPRPMGVFVSSTE